LADIFISYAREDRDFVERLANSLEREGWVVWWDRNLRPGAEFSTEIERELRAAGAVLVCWSVHGVKSSWVRDEAMLARREDKLRTISLDRTEPPIGFMQFHAHDMADWSGEPSHPSFTQLAAELRTTLTGPDDCQKKDYADKSATAAPDQDRGFRDGAGLRTTASVIAIIVLIAAGGWWMSEKTRDDAGRDTASSSTHTLSAEGAEIAPGLGEISVVVLPFENRSLGPEDQYFADGVSEQILNALSGVDGLQVVARATAFSFRNRDLALNDFAELLGVTHVLEGSVARSGDRVRITVQLADAVGGFNVWSNSYEWETEDLFVVQDEIAQSIVSELPIEIGVQDSVATVAGDAVIDAYDYYLLAREKWNRNTFESHEEVTTLLDRALAISPNFVEALALRAIVEISLSDYAFGSRVKTMDEALPNAKSWIDAAWKIDSDAPEVLYALGLYHHAQYEVATAQSYYREALEARPNFTSVRRLYALTLLMIGNGREAVSELETALQYDPAHAQSNATLFDQYILLNEIEKARAILDKLELVDPDQRGIPFYRARWLRFAGRIAESLVAVEALIEAKPDQPAACSELYAEVLLRLAEYERVEQEFESCNDGAAWVSRALTLQGRHDEAVQVADDWHEAEPEGPWPVDALLRALYYAGRWSEYVETMERNFHNAVFFRDLKTQPVGSVAAGPYVRMGHNRSPEIISDAYENVERLEEGGNAYPEIDLYTARVLVLDGRVEEAMRRLERAVAKTLYTPWIPIDPVLGRLAGREDYEALVSEIEQQVNTERAKLDLAPVTLTRSVSRIDSAPAQD
jgi:TolB-like protein